MKTKTLLFMLVIFMAINNSCSKESQKVQENNYTLTILPKDGKIEYNVGDAIEFTCLVNLNNSPVPGIVLGIDDEMALQCTQLEPTNSNGMTSYSCIARESGSVSFGFYNGQVNGNYTIHIIENESNDSLHFMKNYSQISLGENKNVEFE